MVLPTGAISAQEINIELSRPSNQTISFSDTAVRALAGVVSGPISFSDFRGKSAVTVTISPYTLVTSGTATFLNRAFTGSVSAGTVTAWEWTVVDNGEGMGSIQSGGNTATVTLRVQTYISNTPTVCRFRCGALVNGVWHYAYVNFSYQRNSNNPDN